MQQEYKVTRGKQALKVLLAIFSFLALCALCATAGYYFARSKSPLKNENQEEKSLHEQNTGSENNTPFHLPTLHTEENISVSPSSLAQPEIIEYLVIAEGNTVRLYRLTQNGEKEFQRNLDISLSALSEEDRLIFTEGRILKSEDELSSLLEDYTS